MAAAPIRTREAVSDDVPKIPPQRAKLALSAGLREMADAIDAGEVQWVAAVAMYTPEGGNARERAFDQISGFPDPAAGPFWMLATGALRSAYLDFEAQLMEVAASTITDTKTFPT